MSNLFNDLLHKQRPNFFRFGRKKHCNCANQMNIVVAQNSICSGDVFVKYIHCKEVRVRHKVKDCVDFNHPIYHFCSHSFCNFMFLERSSGVTLFFFSEAKIEVIFSQNSHILACCRLNSILNRLWSNDFKLWSRAFSAFVARAGDGILSFLCVDLRSLWLVPLWRFWEGRLLSIKGVLLRNFDGLLFCLSNLR